MARALEARVVEWDKSKAPSRLQVIGHRFEQKFKLLDAWRLIPGSSKARLDVVLRSVK